MKKTCLIAACSGYTIDQIKPWVNSLKKTGYSGDVIVVVYDPEDNKLLEYLKKNNIGSLIATINGDLHVATQRFLDFSGILSGDLGKNYDIIITTDIRDVIFQSNPDVWVRNNIKDKSIIATGEGVTYNHEDWNGDMLQRHFGDMFNELKNEETLCSGIIAGKKDMMVKLFRSIGEITYFGKDPGAFVDQCYYNIAIRKIFAEHVLIAGGNTSWCANLGTLKAIPENTPKWSTGEKSEYDKQERVRNNQTFTEVLMCKVPTMNNDLVCNENNEPYAIVHQYDRYSPWKEIILNKYSK